MPSQSLYIHPAGPNRTTAFCAFDPRPPDLCNLMCLTNACSVPYRAHSGRYMSLPIRPPYLPMEALSVSVIPEGPDWQYEPKWDGFRCLAFRDGRKVRLQSKAGQPLERYFPDLVDRLLRLAPDKFVLDGEIVIASDGDLSFNDLLLRIHPA